MQDVIEEAARAAHEVNVAYCQALGETTSGSWDEAPDWQRESSRRGAAAVLEDPDYSPEKAHHDWMEQKRADGWVYGEAKDPERKTHPCMVPYEDLPAEQRAKDHVFVATVRAVAQVMRVR